MKKFVPLIAFIFMVSSADAQNKMYINKITGMVDSLLLSQIKNVGFQSSPGFDTTITKWMDYPGNPILHRSMIDSNSVGIQMPHLLYDIVKYKMWFTLRSVSGGVGYAASSDGIQWAHHDQPIVLDVGSIDKWDSKYVMAGPVIKNGAEYLMFYTGFNGDTLKIGFATSSDGIIWIKDENPILSPTEKWESNNIGVTSVINIGNELYMFYYGIDAQSNAAIGLATSSDGKTWTKDKGNPILTGTEPWENGSIYFPSVIQDSGKYKMVYASRNLANSSAEGFGMATSIDGKIWIKNSSISFFNRDGSQGLWAKSIGYPCLIKAGESYRVYYTGELSVPNLNEFNAIGFVQQEQQSVSIPPTDSIFLEMYNGMKLWYSISEIHEITFSPELIAGREQQLIQHIVSTFALRQNYPNPFNPSTTIEYSIPDRGNVHVKIYDIQGRLVSVLEQTHKEPGNYKVLWNGRTTNGIPVSSGTYFCSVEFNGNVLVKKLALIK